ncbi:YopX family protein [Salinicoccus roseus]|uniref:YopX family protein n=1 Tax=Salinicoccus roseus TaxID=45670 RepID=UPI0022FFF442|nr:YopX family protein [Salinicoccus roseus]
MREIKFRAWDTEDKVMRSWEELTIEKEKDDDSWFIGYPESKVVTRFDHLQTLEQYTGLKDKNGTEIYEGDILGQEIKGRMRIKGAIKFGNYEEYMDGGISDWTGFYLDDVEDGPVGSFSFLVQKLGEEVIGNIHENPELLEQSS